MPLRGDVLQRFGFQFSSPQPTPLSISHSLSAPPSDESVEPSGPYPELVGCLMYLMTCTRPELAYSLSLLARYVAPGRHRKVHWDAAKRVLRYLWSTSGMGLVLGGRGSVVLTGHADASWAEIYAGAMAAQELRWLTYLLTDLGEQPRSPPVLYQRGQLRLAYVATRANTADIFTKAIPPACLAFLTGLVTTCSPPLCLWGGGGSGGGGSGGSDGGSGGSCGSGGGSGGSGGSGGGGGGGSQGGALQRGGFGSGQRQQQ
ncbi:unnamed protein product [Closterium sp. NIES-53]